MSDQGDKNVRGYKSPGIIINPIELGSLKIKTTPVAQLQNNEYVTGHRENLKLKKKMMLSQTPIF